ncbi:fasciclin arabinogalactan protein [Trifolium repens]|nr:fasciclin arabinogalactan protein [Trifolium repens]
MARKYEKKLLTLLLITTTILLVCIFALFVNFLPNPSVNEHGRRKLIAKPRKNNHHLNLTKILLDSKHHNIAFSLILSSGFLNELEEFKDRSGMTLFMPNDVSFGQLLNSVSIPSLWFDKKTLLIKAHASRGYYRLALLKSAMQENLPTFATDSTAAKLYTLNISGVTGVVKVSTVIVEEMLVKIMYDQKSVVVYGVSGVLLPTFLTLISYFVLFFCFLLCFLTLLWKL